MSLYIKGLYAKNDFIKLDKPQVLLFGRSNVGKSSLINLILNQNLAKTSQRPGKTQAIHLYLEKDYYLVDLPGYGFSSASKVVNETFEQLIISYLDYIKNDNFLVLLLVDHKVGLQPKDKEALDYLDNNKIKYLIVLTKSDKTNQSERAKTKNSLQVYFNKNQVVATSSLKKKGFTELKKLIYRSIYE